MQRAAPGVSLLVRISSWRHSLMPQPYRGVSRLLPSCATVSPRRQYRLWLPYERRGVVNGTHGPRVASRMRYPTTLLVMNIGHSAPCNVIESDRVLMANEDQKSNKTFVVRRATSLDDLQWVMNQATEEGWMYHEKEAECYFTAGLLPDFFIGELNGERIASLSFVNHGNSLYFGGNLIVLKPYRGQGYGKKLWDTAVASLDDQYIIHGASVLNINDAHTLMNLPTCPGWISRRYTFDISHACKSLAGSHFPPFLAQIMPASQADFEKVFVYGADMLGTSQACKLVLAAMIAHAQESSWVAIGNQGEVVGYLIMSKTIRFPEEGYHIAPLYADSADIARSLLKVAVAFAAPNNPRHIFLDIAADLNPKGASVLESELEAKKHADFVFFSIGAKGIPSKPQYKVFGAASLGIM